MKTGWCISTIAVAATAVGAAVGCGDKSESTIAGPTSCPNGYEACPSGCVDTSADPTNCGRCGMACAADQTCVSGVCTGGGTAGSGPTGGTGPSGGTVETGGIGPTGGTEPTGGVVGDPFDSGAGIDGGGGTTGGTSGTGGTAGGTSTTGSCERTVGSCTSPEVRVTDLNIGVQVTGYGTEYDTQPLPMVISAMPSGGSRVAWLGTDGNAYVAQLDCGDQMVGSPISIPAHDIQDIYADDEGGVLLLTRDATGSGSDRCGPGPLCGGTSAPCYDMYLVRFNKSGTEEWATKVTNLSDSMEGYDNGARFVWAHYQHHGRIAFDGSNYAAYFCIGITVQNGSCVDIHEGDRMQVVSSSGAPVNHRQALEVGCSHSWTTRIVWDPRVSQFMMLCATDNPDPGTGFPCRIARPAPYRTIAPVQCNGRFWGGDLVLAKNSGYWTAYTQEGSISLVHFTESGPDQTIDNAGSADHAKLISYGENHMLLAWESGSSMAAKVLDSASGATIGSQWTINVQDHNYHAFKAYPDGSVAYPAAGSNNTSIRIARVMPCQ
ncbi:MAG: hypothetical protein JXA30_13525 [Deltaproteobacteria bacterium]|nr:hypothetical protein [Deltaproteobacteria bacterium]